MDHPNICRLLEIYAYDSDNDSGSPMAPVHEQGEQAEQAARRGNRPEPVYLIMELCSGKELYDRLAAKKRYQEADAAKAVREMLNAVNYCHGHGIVHRDLKLE